MRVTIEHNGQTTVKEGDYFTGIFVSDEKMGIAVEAIGVGSISILGMLSAIAALRKQEEEGYSQW